MRPEQAVASSFCSFTKDLSLAETALSVSGLSVALVNGIAPKTSLGVSFEVTITGTRYSK